MTSVQLFKIDCERGCEFETIDEDLLQWLSSPTKKLNKSEERCTDTSQALSKEMTLRSTTHRTPLTRLLTHSTRAAAQVRSKILVEAKLGGGYRTFPGITGADEIHRHV